MRSSSPARLGIGTLSVAAAVLVWQALTGLGVLDSFSFPSAVDIGAALLGEVTSVRLWLAVAYTLQSWALGLLISVAIALPLGMFLGINAFAYRSCQLVIEFLKPIPVVAILPLAVLLFGTTLPMKLLLIVFGTVWELFVQVIYGVQDMDPVVLETARAYRVGYWDRLRYVRLPSAAPFLATGLRLAATDALILSIVAELIGGGQGLGLALSQAEYASAFAQMYALIIVIGLCGLAMNALFVRLERRVLSWHPSHREVVA